MIELRRHPVFPTTELRRELDRLFDGFGRETFNPFGCPRPLPALNVWEDDERLLAEAEVPGLGMDDIEILIHGNELTVKGHRNPVAGENLTYHRRERRTGDFSHFVTLPTEVDPDGVEATLKDGVLTIVMPKAERARVRKIAVKTA